MSAITSHSLLNISETVRDTGLVPKDHQQEIASCHCRLTSLRFVEVASGYYPLRRLFGDASEHWSRHSFPVAWTTATLCSSASRKDWWTGCSRFRTPPPVWWLVLDVQTT